MASKFTRFQGIKKNVIESSKLSQNYMDLMIVREHVDKKKNMHPNAKKRWNEMTQTPEPLKFELHNINTPEEEGKETLTE